MKILYLDDNFINRLIVQKFLQKESHDIMCVEKASEAFEHFGNHEFDYMIIDLNLDDPDIDGFGVLSYIKSKWPEKTTKFAAHSSYIGQEWEDRCKQAGFDIILPKPFEIDDFKRLII